MQQLRIPLRAVLYKEAGLWMAHCLEFDLIGDGETTDEALGQLTQAIAIQLEVTARYQNPANLFQPAAGRFFRMFAAGKDVATGELKFQPLGESSSVTIEAIETREYSDADLAVNT